MRHCKNRVHRLWKGQSLKRLKSSHSLVKDLSRGFSMTEHVESELLLLLLPGKQKRVPQKNPERKKHADGKLVPRKRHPEGPAN